MNEIIEWLENHGVFNYTLVPDACWGFVVDVLGDVSLEGQGLTEIPIKFNIVAGDFYCQDNLLVSLKGCPESVGGDFDCSHNQLTTLQFSPKHVKRSFHCDNNQLTSLEYCTDKVSYEFNCRNNHLTNLLAAPQCESLDCSSNLITSLKGCPVGISSINCAHNHLTSLEFLPTEFNCNANFDCSHNLLTDLQYCENFETENFYCDFNHLNTLEYLPKNVKYTFSCYNNPELGEHQTITDFPEFQIVSDIYKIKRETAILNDLVQPNRPSNVYKI